MELLRAIYGWIVTHQTTATLFAYYFSSAFVGSLEMPDATSGKTYRFFFRFLNRLAANWSRANASLIPANLAPSQQEDAPSPQPDATKKKA